jgi:hypothetical protein
LLGQDEFGGIGGDVAADGAEIDSRHPEHQGHRLGLGVRGATVEAFDPGQVCQVRVAGRVDHRAGLEGRAARLVLDDGAADGVSLLESAGDIAVEQELDAGLQDQP